MILGENSRFRNYLNNLERIWQPVYIIIDVPTDLPLQSTKDKMVDEFWNGRSSISQYGYVIH